MDFTKITCISEKCKGKGIIMGGAGGAFGPRISFAKVKCHECGLLLMVLPVSDKYEYTISATTEDERKLDRIKKAIEESELKLAKTITRIKETGY